MSIRKDLEDYCEGMKAYDKCHPPTIHSQWEAFYGELREFMETPNIGEAWDILHSGGRLFWKLTGIPLQLLAIPTVYKHGQRYGMYGCIRSQRNCEGKCCSKLNQ